MTHRGHILMTALMLACSDGTESETASDSVALRWTAGETISAAIGHGLVLVLVPSGDGFRFDVRPAGTAGGFAFITPPYHGPNALDVSRDDFAPSPLIGPERSFFFVTSDDDASRALEALRSPEDTWARLARIPVATAHVRLSDASMSANALNSVLVEVQVDFTKAHL
jgi:hypothetical protein